MGRGKGPDGFDAVGNEEVTYLLGGGSGNGDDAHQHLPFLAKLGKSGNGIDGLAGFHLAVYGLIGVKGGHNFQAVFCKTAVAQQRPSQFAASVVLS